MPFFCLSPLRRVATVFALGCSSIVFAQTQPVFPVLTFEAYPVANALPMVDGDVNGDGAVDTVYVGVAGSPAVSSLTTALGAKAGGAPTLVTAGHVNCTVTSIVLADLNKDNKLDAAATCSEGTVAVLQGNGDGSFQPATTYAVASLAKVVIADMNGDGYPELLASMNTAKTGQAFAIFLNQGSAGAIHFGTPVVYGDVTLTGGPLLFVGDVDGDGKPDVVAGGNPAITNTLAVQVFLGKGDGTFGANSTGGWTNDVTVGDFNADGTVDIVQVSKGLSSSVILSLTEGTKGQSTVSLLLGSVVARPMDVNGDGHMDLVLTGSTTTILLGDGKGNLSVGQSYATPGSFYGTRVGESGKLNLLFTTPRGFYTLKGRGDGTFEGLPAMFGTKSPVAVDVNSDGIADVVSPGPGPAPGVMFGRGDGRFGVAATSNIFFIGVSLAADFSGDGLTDVAQFYNPSLGPNVNAIMMTGLKGSGDGNFVASSAVDSGLRGIPSGVAGGDFDGDGNRDVALSYVDTTGNTSGLVLVRGNGDGTFIKPAGSLATSTAAVQGGVLSSDLNGDGRPDLVWGETAYMNQAGGTFVVSALPVHGTAFGVADLDGDGVADVVIDNAIYAGNGDGTFKPTAIYVVATPADAKVVSVAVGDVNGDGHPDVIVQYMADMAGLSVAYGDGRGGFTADSNVYTTGSVVPVSGALGRLNNQAPALPNDGRPDYVVFADGAVVSMLNQTNPAPTAPALVASKVVLNVAFSSAIPLKSMPVSLNVTGLSPTGTVTLTTSDGAVLGKATLQPSITYLYPTFATPGTYTVTASYSGDANNAASVSNPVTITVAKGQTTTSLILLPQAFPTNVQSAISASVSGDLLTGQVTFSLNGLVIGTVKASGLPSLGYRFTTPGTYQLVASYSGDASNLPSTSTTTSVTVVPGPDFSLSATPTSNTVKAGATAVYTITAAPINGYSATIMLNCQGCSGNGVPLTVTSVGPASVQIGLTAPTSTQTGGPRAVIVGAGQAVLLMLMGWSRRGRRMLRRWPLCLLVVGIAIGLGGLSGCSSGKGSSDTTPVQGTTYDVVIVGTDVGFTNQSHTVTLHLTVTP